MNGSYSDLTGTLGSISRKDNKISLCEVENSLEIEAKETGITTFEL